MRFVAIRNKDNTVSVVNMEHNRGYYIKNFSVLAFIKKPLSSYFANKTRSYFMKNQNAEILNV